MKLLYHSIFLEHDTGTHPENKTRLSAFEQIPNTELADATAYLSLVHSQEYIEKVISASNQGLPLDPDTITSPRSYEVASSAVALALEAATTSDFALVRPPGHHAYPTYGSGFCLFNSIAIAVQNLVSQGKKVLILDFDGHCGDGTEHIFYDTNQVLFWSLHQSPAFPGKGFIRDIGKDAGAGYTVNVEMPPGTGDDLFFEAIERLLPIAKQFNPDIVAVSAGFDAHQADPLLQLRLSLNAYFRLGQLLSTSFKQVFAVLEGGYNTRVLPQCIHNFVNGFNGQPQSKMEPATKSDFAIREIFTRNLNELKKNLSPYW
ncbi:MAG: histone deacetylase family protein [Cyclobacteriaceae bacterium]